MPDTEDAGLATLAVSLLSEKVRELKREWYRRFDQTVEEVHRCPLAPPIPAGASVARRLLVGHL